MEKEIVENGSGNILDFKMKSLISVLQKKKNVKNLYAFLRYESYACMY